GVQAQLFPDCSHPPTLPRAPGADSYLLASSRHVTALIVSSQQARRGIRSRPSNGGRGSNQSRAKKGCNARRLSEKYQRNHHPTDDKSSSETARVVLIPERAPNADAYAERFVRPIKAECLDRIIPIGERHFRHAITEFVEHYHRERNH
ncbi:MAG TPA: hypothetical protein VKC35_07030, partial [Vicinamibacterales bacterium]|nr:hypothetical protein [Vicinamibacterales bacterium]